MISRIGSDSLCSSRPYEKRDVALTVCGALDSRFRGNERRIEDPDAQDYPRERP
jgi:hypothetical protein